MSTITQKRLTAEDLLRMPDRKSYELVNGELVEHHMGWNAAWTASRLYQFLANYCEANPIATAITGGDAGYQCFPDDPEKVRKPDVSAIRLERLPPREEREGWCRVAPDVAAEIVSPNDVYAEVEEKVDEYLGAGVKLVWVLDPANHSLRIHRSNGTVADLDTTGELIGEDVLPGFRCRVADLFEPSVRSP